MAGRKHQDVDQFIQVQKEQLGLSDAEAAEVMRQAMAQVDEPPPDLDAELAPPPMPGAPAPVPRSRQLFSANLAIGDQMSDPYLPQSQTIKARPTRVSRIRSFLYEYALPNEYIVQIGLAEAKPALGGKFFKPGRNYLKFPAAVQTVYFTSDNANRNYQGLRIDGYACWRVDPEKPELAARSLDFSDQDNPMGNTNRILRTICTEAIRHLIANITIEDALTKKDEIGRDLKNQLQRIERAWGVIFDQVGIERVTILSSKVFEDLQQKTRDSLRLAAAESRMATDRDIEKKKGEYSEEMARIQSTADKEARILKATTESQVHKVELEEAAKRQAEERRNGEERRRAEAEAEERNAQLQAGQAKNQATRQAEVAAHQAVEDQKLRLLQAQAEAEGRIKAAETAAKVAAALAESEKTQAQVQHERLLAVQALDMERTEKAAQDEDRLAEARQAAELARAASRLAQERKARAEDATLKHRMELDRLERLKIEEESRNLVSANRLKAEFIARLPEIVSGLKIDRYTVLDGTGDSPLTRTLSQVFTVLQEHGWDKIFTPNEPPQDRD